MQIIVLMFCEQILTIIDFYDKILQLFLNIFLLCHEDTDTMIMVMEANQVDQV